MEEWEGEEFLAGKELMRNAWLREVSKISLYPLMMYALYGFVVLRFA